jgi:hypothetical protein
MAAHTDHNLTVSADVDEFEKVGTEFNATEARSTICCIRDYSHV